MRTTKILESLNPLIAMAVEESVLSDGSKVFALRIGAARLDCVNEKDASKAYRLVEEAIRVIST